MMKVKRDNLLTIAAVVWMIAGINILIIGISAYMASVELPWWALLLMVIGTLAVIAIFHVMFGKLVNKHVARIRGFEDTPQNPLLFFDLKSYLIMAFMIVFGIMLRVSGVVPNWGIAFFYTGLGTSLFMAGVGFMLHRIHGKEWSFHKGTLHRKAV